MARRPRFVRRIIEAQHRERLRLIADLGAAKGLMPLLMKRRNGCRWTRNERLELCAQLRSLAHLSPYLFILLLPGSFLALPALAWWLDRRRMRRPDTGGSGGDAASIGAS